MIPFLEQFRNRLINLGSKLSESNTFWSILSILSIITSFGLGRLSNVFDQKPVFSIEEMKATEVTNFPDMAKFTNTSTSTVIASRKGKKYYFVWCKSAGNIKESNKIYFKNEEEEAKLSGRTLAGSCN